jgi:hypothetical protein
MHYDSETITQNLQTEPIFENTYDDYYLLNNIDDANNKVKYRSFEKVEEDNDIKSYKKYTKDITFFFNPIEPILCEIFCKIGLNETQTEELYL